MNRPPEQPSRPKELPTVVPIPKETVREFLDGSFAARLHDPQKPVTRGRYFTRKETLPGIEEEIELRVDYEASGGHKTLFFGFVTSGPVEKSEMPVATISLEVSNLARIGVPHRLVDEPRRRSGVGSRLYAQVEEWVVQVATQQQTPVTLTADMSQVDVFKWYKDLGYAPAEKDKELYDDLVANLGVTNKYWIDDGRSGTGHSPNTIFERTPQGHPKADPIRIRMEKVIAPTEAV